MERQVTNYCSNCKELADRNAELLEALEKFVAHMPSKPHCTIGHLQAYDMATKAIAKAKGDSK